MNFDLRLKTRFKIVMAKVDKDVLESACKSGDLQSILKYKGKSLQIRYSEFPANGGTSLHLAAQYVQISGSMILFHVMSLQ